MFSKYHYLNTSMHQSSSCYVGLINEKPVAFFSVLHQPHCIPNKKRGHRLVVNPQYQGVGLGKIMAEQVGKIYHDQGCDFSIVASTPALMVALKNSKCFVLSAKGRKKSHHGKNDRGSSLRLTSSYKYVQPIREDGKTYEEAKNET